MKKIFRKINKFLFKEKKKHHIVFNFISVLLIVAFVANLFFVNNQTALSATYTFNQTSWSGGITANNAVHPTNQTSWTQFSASTTGMTTANSGADLQFVLTASSTIHTTDTDFSAGTVSSTTIVGASIKLDFGIDYGDGTDGPLIVSSANQNINNYASAGANNYSAGATSITVDSTTGFSTGDEGLVIQMQHATNAGKYEFIKNITVTDSTTISFSSSLTNDYYGTGSSGKTQVIRVPQYTNVTVDSGASIVPTAWSNGTGKGGIVVFRANGTVAVTGSIDASGKGYGGGAGGGTGSETKGTPGESYIGLGVKANSPLANYGAGGGGGMKGSGSNNLYNGGGGGGYGAIGGTASGGVSNTLDGGKGGAVYGVSTLSTLFMGSGGGGGSSHGPAASCGANGSSGGGGSYIFFK